MEPKQALEILNSGAVLVIQDRQSQSPTYRLYRVGGNNEWLAVPPQTAQELISRGLVTKTAGAPNESRYVATTKHQVTAGMERRL